MTILYHFWSSHESRRVRLALAHKGLAYEDRPLDYGDDATFFELGVARHVPVLKLDSGELLTDSLQILHRIDALFPDTAPLVEGRIDDAAWQALLDWRSKVDPLLQRLYAPVLPAYADIGDDPETLAAYKTEVERRFGLSLEALANDRYAGFAQLDKSTRLAALGKHLAKSRFYLGQLSIADLLLAADLHPLQLLDGVSLPIDLMYYLRRVDQVCGHGLGDGLLVTL